MGIRLKAGHNSRIDLAFDQMLDIGQQLTFVAAHERDRVTFATGAGCAPYPMHVIARHVRQLVVDDIRQPIYV